MIIQNKIDGIVNTPVVSGRRVSGTREWAHFTMS
jgi:hypothetical protein